MNRHAPVLSNDLGALFVESKKCIARYDFAGAAEVLRRAHKLDPANDRILVDLGSACAKAYDFAAAQRWFDEATRISQTAVPALNAIGHAWLEVRNFEAAQAWSARPVPLYFTCQVLGNKALASWLWHAKYNVRLQQERI